MNKILQIELNKSHIIEKEKLFNLFTPFFDEEFGFEFNDKSMEIQLGAIDYNSFKLQVNKTLTNGILNDETKEVVQKMFDSISSVKSYGLKGNKRVYVDYNKEIKVKNRKEKQNNRGQFFYTKENNFSVDSNEIPEKFENQIICGDSLDILKELPDNCIDVIITSPPYNFGLDYASTDDDSNWEKYFEKLFAIFTQGVRVLKYGGRAIINVQPLFSDYIPTHHIISNFFIQQKMIWKGEILWEKNNYNCKYTAWGSWKSPSNPYLKYTWEFLEIFCKGDLKKKGIADNIDISADEFKKWVVGKWSIAPEKNMKEFNHPAMFPEELVLRAVKLFSFRNDIILDPFNGTGTTTTVAKKFNRRYIGIDISKEYCLTAEKRLTNFLL
jgi:DNA modification methylase